MKSLQQFIRESYANPGNKYISNRYTPVDNHIQYLKNITGDTLVTIDKTEDGNGIEISSSRFRSNKYRDLWLRTDIGGGSEYFAKCVADWAQDMKFECWYRNVSNSDYRIVFWPADVKPYPYKDQSKKIF